MSASHGISAFPDSDNLLSWAATIEGAQGTVFEGLKFKLSMKFPPNYPYAAPTVRFESACFHPNGMAAVFSDTFSRCTRKHLSGHLKGNAYPEPLILG